MEKLAATVFRLVLYGTVVTASLMDFDSISHREIFSPTAVRRREVWLQSVTCSLLLYVKLPTAARYVNLGIESSYDNFWPDEEGRINSRNVVDVKNTSNIRCRLLSCVKKYSRN